MLMPQPRALVRRIPGAQNPRCESNIAENVPDYATATECPKPRALGRSPRAPYP